MPTPEQKDPSFPAGPAGGNTSVGTSGLTKRESIGLAVIAIVGALILIFKH